MKFSKIFLLSVGLLATPALGWAESDGGVEDITQMVTCNFDYETKDKSVKVHCQGSGANYDEAEDNTLRGCPDYYKLGYLERNNAWANRKHFGCTVPGGPEG